MSALARAVRRIQPVKPKVIAGGLGATAGTVIADAIVQAITDVAGRAPADPYEALIRLAVTGLATVVPAYLAPDDHPAPQHRAD